MDPVWSHEPSEGEIFLWLESGKTCIRRSQRDLKVGRILTHSCWRAATWKAWEGMWAAYRSKEESPVWRVTGKWDLSPIITKNWIWPEWGWKQTHPQSIQKRTQCSQQQDFNFVIYVAENPAEPLYSDFWPTELWINTFVLCSATTFVVMCYDSNRKLVYYWMLLY